VVVLAVLVAGCRGASDPKAAPAVVTSAAPTTVVETTTTTTTANPWAAVVDLPYVQRVLKAIYSLEGEAVRYAYTHKIRDGEVDARLRAIFGGPALEEARRVLDNNIAEGLVQFADPPGNADVEAVEIVQATPTCMVIRADLDFSPFFKRPRPRPPPAFIQLSPGDILPINPTGWGVVVAGDPDPSTNVKVCR